MHREVEANADRVLKRPAVERLQTVKFVRGQNMLSSVLRSSCQHLFDMDAVDLSAIASSGNNSEAMQGLLLSCH